MTVTRWMRATAGESVVFVSVERPVAIIQAPDAPERVVAWPELDVGIRGVGQTVLATHDGVWVIYRTSEVSEATRSSARTVAVYVSTDGSCSTVELDPAARVLGATRLGLWTSQTAVPHPDDRDAWTRDVEVTIVDPAGNARHVTTTMNIQFVADDAESTLVMYYPHAPEVDVSAFGRSYAYARALATLTAPPADDLNLADVTNVELSDAEMLAILTRHAAQQTNDGPAEPDVPWMLATLTADEIDAAIAEVTREFSHLDEYWHDEQGRKGPLSRGLRDPQVDVVGEWPDTRVEVTFRHPQFSQGRMRRTILVFDSAGRIAPNEYAAIHLMEDLDTAPMAEPWLGADGVLNF